MRDNVVLVDSKAYPVAPEQSWLKPRWNLSPYTVAKGRAKAEEILKWYMKAIRCSLTLVH